MEITSLVTFYHIRLILIELWNFLNKHRKNQKNDENIDFNS